MKAKFLDMLCCPACQGTLTLTNDIIAHNEIWSGQLTCAQGHTYNIENGMPHLYVDDERWVSKAVEAAGWVQFHKDAGIYEIVDDPVDLKIPYFAEEPWYSIGKQFDYVIDQLNLTGNERVLDLGAGRGWAAKQFALRGCDVVALDIVPDENVGLGRAKALMENAGTYFERLIADGENMPFQANQFDLVFCAATLHHTSYLVLLLTEVQRILKNGGRLCAINEPCIDILQDEAAVINADAGDEIKYGINERRPNIVGYCHALSQSGLLISQLECIANIAVSDQIVEAIMYDTGAAPPPIRPTEPIQLYGRVFNYLRNYVRGWRKGVLSELTVPKHLSKRSQQTYAILLWTTQGVILFATKQSPP